MCRLNDLLLCGRQRYQYNVTGLTPGKQYKITISYDNGNKYYVTGGLKVEGLGSEELNTYGEESTNS